MTEIHKVEVVTSTKEEAAIQIQQDKLVNVKAGPSAGRIMAGENMVEVRNGGDFYGKAIYLPKNLNWVITKDNENSIVLVPYRK